MFGTTDKTRCNDQSINKSESISRWVSGSRIGSRSIRRAVLQVPFSVRFYLLSRSFPAVYTKNVPLKVTVRSGTSPVLHPLESLIRGKWDDKIMNQTGYGCVDGLLNYHSENYIFPVYHETGDFEVWKRHATRFHTGKYSKSRACWGQYVVFHSRLNACMYVIWLYFVCTWHEITFLNMVSV